MSRFRRVHLKVVLPLVGAGVAALVAGASIAFAARNSAPIGQPLGQGVVVIETNLAYQNAAAAGTGIVLTSSGRVLTNNHVIAGATTVKVVIPGTGRSYAARVMGYSRSADVAVLQLSNASNLTTLPVSTSSTIGQAVRALGNAGGTGALSSASGTITAKGKSITAGDEQGSSERLIGLIETNAGVVAGDSGGPLLDTAGRIVGMNVAASASAGFQMVTSSVAYAIPIGKALTIAKQIGRGTSSATVHIGPTAFLGIGVATATDGGYGGYPGDGYGAPTAGALITGVVNGGPAATAGLVAGDVITAINGRSVSSPTVVSSIVLKLKPGAKATISFTDQSGTSQTATVTLGSGPPQ